MRTVTYEIRQANGTTSFTTKYSEATKEGNRIIKVHLVDVDMRTEKEKQLMEKHAEKVAKKIAKRKE